MNYNERMDDIKKLKKEPNYGLLWCRHGYWLTEQAKKVEEYEKTILKIKELYESDDENKLDEFLYGLFTNEVYNDSY